MDLDQVFTQVRSYLLRKEVNTNIVASTTGVTRYYVVAVREGKKSIPFGEFQKLVAFVEERRR